MARPSALRAGVRAAGLPPPLLRLAPSKRRLALVPGRHLRDQHARHRPRGRFLRPAARVTRRPGGLPGVAGGHGWFLRLLHYGQHLGGRADGVAPGEGIRVWRRERWGWLGPDDDSSREFAVARWVRGGGVCTLMGGGWGKDDRRGRCFGAWRSPLFFASGVGELGEGVLAMNRNFHAGMRMHPSCASHSTSQRIRYLPYYFEVSTPKARNTRFQVPCPTPYNS